MWRNGAGRPNEKGRPSVMKRHQCLQNYYFMQIRLFSVPRITLNVRSRNRLKQKLATYDAMFENGMWNETEYNVHLQPLLAFAEKAYSKRLRRRLVGVSEGQKSLARTACCAAVAGTTPRGTAECRTGTTTTPTTGTTTTGSVSPFPSLRS